MHDSINFLVNILSTKVVRIEELEKASKLVVNPEEPKEDKELASKYKTALNKIAKHKKELVYVVEILTKQQQMISTMETTAST